jgi:hypothetical protein
MTVHEFRARLSGNPDNCGPDRSAEINLGPDLAAATVRFYSN